MLRVLANYGAPAGTQLVMLRKGEYEVNKNKNHIFTILPNT
jgi:hypothetical protein